ncbi:MAG: gliding motility-associated C-terminal domain-containing protein [Prevotellaceae bacterium]|jgi:gliding motility-associated-like protein|nr:gliding motility-associated C-terminal domain-containing protein [Prevotellaceae bacterium]
MKNSFCLSFFLTVSLGLSAQFSVNTNITHQYYTDYVSTGLDYLVVFDRLATPNPGDYAEIHYDTQGSSFVWEKYQNGIRTPYSSSTTSSMLHLDLETSMGYVLNVDGTDVLTVWVIDFSAYMPAIRSVTWDDPNEAQCENLTLSIDMNMPVMRYQNPAGNTYNLKREVEITYETLEFNETWNPVEKKETFSTPASAVDVEAPLKNTSFVVEGDRFAKDLNRTVSLESDVYVAIAVEASPTTQTSVRDVRNENERPDDASKREGSAPLEINFTARPTPTVQYYNWIVYKEDTQLFTRKDEHFAYKFEEFGKYKVKLTVSSDFCAYTDSTIVIEVRESELLAPRVFTPNGDGINEEFRVAYKSIVEFEAWVYNRWGRLVYHWTNPAQGWDGKINGKNATEGAYFYVIKAKGADGYKYLLKGDLSLLRGKKR